MKDSEPVQILDSVVRELLAVLEIFRGCTDDELGTLVEASERVRFKAGEIVLREGQDAEGLFVLLAGSLDVTVHHEGQAGESALEVNLNTLTANDCFGEYSFVDEQSVSATVIANEDSELVKLEIATFRSTIKSHEHIGLVIYRNLLDVLIRRLRRKDHEIDFVTQFWTAN